MIKAGATTLQAGSCHVATASPLGGAISTTRTVVVAINVPPSSSIVTNGVFELGGLYCNGSIAGALFVAVRDSTPAGSSAFIYSMPDDGRFLFRCKVWDDGGTAKASWSVMDENSDGVIKSASDLTIASGEIEAAASGWGFGLDQNWNIGSRRNIANVEHAWMCVIEGEVSDEDLQTVWAEDALDGYLTFATGSNLIALWGPINKGVDAALTSSGFAAVKGSTFTGSNVNLLNSSAVVTIVNGTGATWVDPVDVGAWDNKRPVTYSPPYSTAKIAGSCQPLRKWIDDGLDAPVIALCHSNSRGVAYNRYTVGSVTIARNYASGLIAAARNEGLKIAGAGLCCLPGTSGDTGEAPLALNAATGTTGGRSTINNYTRFGSSSQLSTGISQPVLCETGEKYILMMDTDGMTDPRYFALLQKRPDGGSCTVKTVSNNTSETGAPTTTHSTEVVDLDSTRLGPLAVNSVSATEIELTSDALIAVGDNISIVDGPQAGQTNEVESYDYPTNTITLKFAWDTLPTSATEINVGGTSIERVDMGSGNSDRYKGLEIESTAGDVLILGVVAYDAAVNGLVPIPVGGSGSGDTTQLEEAYKDNWRNLYEACGAGVGVEHMAQQSNDPVENDKQAWVDEIRAGVPGLPIIMVPDKFHLNDGTPLAMSNGATYSADYQDMIDVTASTGCPLVSVMPGLGPFHGNMIRGLQQDGAHFNGAGALAIGLEFIRLLQSGDVFTGGGGVLFTRNKRFDSARQRAWR